ncbi:hypothetical protein KOI35_17175 [Actinoplanes bogorensis]|uniref:Uncharacterized protein n=1 Tax=Paractinoplanes bogorensis TaxID=1610840 RepID=A0ABS5YR81_9ACTN|nr:hypothetical protein [Actinoplanes bogorensis]MBU2665238.1 hypothetical protein [Actinoplanes bogorensis]
MLTARTLDEPLCATLPLGTHWLWHCLNAVTLYLIARTVDRLASTETDVSGQRSPRGERRGR